MLCRVALSIMWFSRYSLCPLLCMCTGGSLLRPTSFSSLTTLPRTDVDYGRPSIEMIVLSEAITAPPQYLLSTAIATVCFLCRFTAVPQLLAMSGSAFRIISRRPPLLHFSFPQGVFFLIRPRLEWFIFPLVLPQSVMNRVPSAACVMYCYHIGC